MKTRADVTRVLERKNGLFLCPDCMTTMSLTSNRGALTWTCPNREQGKVGHVYSEQYLHGLHRGLSTALAVGI